MLLTILDSWQAMPLLIKVYWAIAVTFSLLFVIQIVFTFFGGDVDTVETDVDTSVESDTGIEFQFLTLKNLIAFFTILGWTGIACLKGDMSEVWAIAISVVAGLAMMTIMASLAYFMGKLTDEGTLDLNNAKGKTASVYLRIPAKRQGLGKVQVNVQGLQTLDAYTDNEEEIKTGAIVEVIDIINNDILLVK